MDHEFTLALADVRLRQTWDLLRMSVADHPDHEAISGALDAIRTANDIIKSLRPS